MRLTIIFLLVFCYITTISSVDHSNFKTCEQSSFCRRCRKVPVNSNKYVLVAGSVNTYSDSITAELINKENNHPFILKLEAIKDNTFRLQIDEKSPLHARYRVNDSLKSHPTSGSIKVQEQTGQELVVTYGDNKAVVHANPFKIDFYQKNLLTVSVNAKGLMHFEHLRKKTEQQPADENLDKPKDDLENQNGEAEIETENHIAEDNDPGMWEENFKSHHDSKPNGPEAIALDFTFPQAKILFGIPQHADSFALKSTSGGEPYRLYNLDVFEFELDSKMALYGSIPVLYGHGPERTAGVFWQNAAETWVDIYSNGENNVMSSIVNFVSGTSRAEPLAAHFMSESGIIDAFILLGPTPLDAFKQYTDLTGTGNLPQLFTLGYHQCRWNYNDETDVETVSQKFDEYDIPMDTMWLDIEYTDGKKYFTWDEHKFPHPLEMIQNLTSLGRHLTIILDPHIKRDNNYWFHNECTDRNYYTKNKEGTDYEGWCWPGAASYPDFFNPEVRKYWADQYLLENFKTITNDVMTWNDMNEPSVFNGPEVTMLKDNVHFGGWEHRDVHNLYGHMNIMGTFDGMLRRDPTQRPFILSRSHFAGSQRYAAIWMGDNAAQWGHIESSIKMCLSEAVAGFSFCGADVGGFFGNVEPEMFERWYQAGAYQPFFRSHAHIDTKRREPWLFGEDTKNVIRYAIRKRYSYLPFWYTMFYEHERNGLPIMRPLLAQYPKDLNSYAIDSQYLLQDRLMVCPVMKPGLESLEVYLPAKDNEEADYWYDIEHYRRYDKAGYQTVDAERAKIPVFQRGGTIIPKKERIRRSSPLMINDPYTLIICLDKHGSANGTLYIDDEKSYEYRDGNFVYIDFEFHNNQLTNNFIGAPKYNTKSWLERIVIAGLKETPTAANLKSGTISETLEVIKMDEVVVVRRPGTNMLDSFIITLKY